ncbi:MAG: Flp family type IVb pilin [Beijerinckiaceae bacterium]
MRLIQKFLSDRSGATSIEYAMIGALMAIMVIFGAAQIGTSMHDVYYDKLDNALK